jgi:DnaJ family protein C protein 17
MEGGDDHYVILGLPSGEEGAMVLDADITKAYRSMALKCHPDKNRNDPKASENFSKINTSYNILMDKTARKLFDDLLRAKRERIQRQSQRDSKRRVREESAFAADPVREARRRKMMSDLEERERAGFAAEDTSRESRREEERISRKLKEEIERIRAMHAGGKMAKAPSSSFQKESMKKDNASTSESSLDEGKVLKAYWEKTGDGYSAQRLRDIFEQFGEVEDVVIKTNKKKQWALVVMVSKDAAVAATGTMCGDLSNPLLVLPLQPKAAFPFAREPVQPDEPKMSNLVGAGYQAFEDSVLKKLQKAAERQK